MVRKGWQVKQHFKHNWHRYLGAVTTLAIISAIVAACVLFPPISVAVVIGFTSTGLMTVLSSVVCLCTLAVTILAGCSVSLGLSSLNHFQQDSLATDSPVNNPQVKSSYSRVSPRLIADQELSSDDDEDNEDLFADLVDSDPSYASSTLTPT